MFFFEFVFRDGSYVVFYMEGFFIFVVVLSSFLFCLLVLFRFSGMGVGFGSFIYVMELGRIAFRI